MGETRTERRLSAILAADVVGYSRLVEADEVATLAELRSLRTELVEPLLRDHSGRLVKLMGDGLLAEFGSVVDAVSFAVALQKAVVSRKATASSQLQIALRIGINLGDVVVEGDDLMGDGVNVAARLEQLCPPGGIMVSGTAYDHLQGKLGLPLDFAGEQRVKNIKRLVRAYSVRIDGAGGARPLRRYKSFATIAALTLIVACLLGLAWRWSVISNTTHSTATLAVLPFESYGLETDARLADGLTEDLITDLARFRDLGVIARNTSDTYKGKSVDVREVGKALNVRYVLEGSLQRQANALRVNAQLIDASSGEHVWSERYDRPANDLFAVQSEISEKVANTLGNYRGLIKQAEIQSIRRKRPSDLAAYEMYLLAQEIHYKQTESDLKQAVELYKTALERDPTFSRAYSGLAHAYHQLARRADDPTELRGLQLANAQMAVQLDPGDSFAYVALGFALGSTGKLAEAEREFDDALQLNPNSFDVLSGYASWASAFGKGEAGARSAERAIQLNPSYPTWNARDFKYAFFMVGRYQDALNAMKRLPEDIWIPGDYAMVAGSLAMLGRDQEAKTVVSRGIAIFPRQLVIERFALRPDWTQDERAKLMEAMRQAGFPACAPDRDLDGSPVKPPDRRLPECVVAAR
jgi:TolB-like protein/class 3 adenylate cyclase